jgi:acyl-CoA thioester hydrolase
MAASSPTAEAVEALLADYAVVVEHPVIWGDMDALGHVNNTVYIRWMEIGRVTYLNRAGLLEMLAGDGIGPILASIECRFKAPVVYPDSVVIGTRIVEMGEDRMIFDHRIVSRSLGRVVAEGRGLMVTYDYTHKRKAPLPESLRRAVEAIENRNPESHQ